MFCTYTGSFAACCRRHDTLTTHHNGSSGTGCIIGRSIQRKEKPTMGNARSSTTGGSLFTASMAKYMSLTKPQVMAVRNTLMPLASKRQGSIKRSQFQDALNQVKVSQHPDQEVLDLLFTMWDLTGTGRVPCAEFIVSMSILACKEDSVEQAIRFALQVADRNRTGKMSSKDASTLLRSK